MIRSERWSVKALSQINSFITKRTHKLIISKFGPLIQTCETSIYDLTWADIV